MHLHLHLHLLCDVLGSRGSTSEDLWGLYYLSPFSFQEWVWAGQWPLVGWQNTTITALLLAGLMWRATSRGYSLLDLLSPRADAQFVQVLRQWRARLGD